MSRTMPWFRFNAAQFLTDTAHLTDAEVGLHVRMLSLFWHHGPLPNDPGWVRKRCPNGDAPRDFKALDGLWVKQDGHLIPEALAADFEDSQETLAKLVAAGRKGGQASGEARREAKASSLGLKRSLKQNQTQSQNQNQKENQKKTPEGGRAPRPSASPFDLDASLSGTSLDTPEFRKAWSEFEAMRASMPKRDQQTDQSRRLALSRLQEAPAGHAVKALILCAESRWKGVHFGLEAVARENNKPVNGHQREEKADVAGSAAYRPWRENVRGGSGF